MGITTKKREAIQAKLEAGERELKRLELERVEAVANPYGGVRVRHLNKKIGQLRLALSHLRADLID